MFVSRALFFLIVELEIDRNRRRERGREEEEEEEEEEEGEEEEREEEEDIDDDGDDEVELRTLGKAFLFFELKTPLFHLFAFSLSYRSCRLLLCLFCFAVESRASNSSHGTGREGCSDRQHQHCSVGNEGVRHIGTAREMLEMGKQIEEKVRKKEEEEGREKGKMRVEMCEMKAEISADK